MQRNEGVSATARLGTPMHRLKVLRTVVMVPNGLERAKGNSLSNEYEKELRRLQAAYLDTNQCLPARHSDHSIHMLLKKAMT